MTVANGETRSGRALARCLCLAVAILALATAPRTAQARPRILPYVHVSASPEALDLGTVPQPGVFNSPATLTVHVAANIAHGGVVISMTAPLTGPGGATIPLNRIWLKLPLTGQYVALTAPVALTGPMNPGVIDIPIKFRVETVLQNPAGEYTGTITLTVGP